MKVKKIVKLYNKFTESKNEIVILVKEKINDILRAGTPEEKEKILKEVNAMLSKDMRIIENKGSYICLQFDPKIRKLYLYHADPDHDKHNLDNSAASILEILRRDPGNVVLYRDDYDLPINRADHFAFAIGYGFCLSMGQRASNFAQAEKEINTERVRNVIAELIMEGALPNGDEVKNVWAEN